MKFFKNKILLLVIAMLAMHISCDDGFAEINTDPQAAISIDPNFQMPWVQLRTSGGRYENWRAGSTTSSAKIWGDKIWYLAIHQRPT